MNFPIVFLTTLFSIAVSTSSSLNRGLVDKTDTSECFLRVKVESCKYAKVIELKLVLGFRKLQTRYVRVHEDMEESCIPIPCVNGQLLGDFNIAAIAKLGAEAEPDHFDAEYDGLYVDENQCEAGADNVVVTCVSQPDSQAEQGHYSDEDDSASSQWQNKYDGSLNLQCPDRQGLYRVQSQHRNKHEDRQWQFYCRVVAQTSFDSCEWTSDYVHAFDEPMYFQCPVNKVLNGVNSYHSNYYEDRRWKFRCCGAPNHYTTDCKISGYVNNFDGDMDYNAGGSYVFVGSFSYHTDYTEDRRFKFASCKYASC